eukprot:5255768-Prymnesium_polylepis.1
MTDETSSVDALGNGATANSRLKKIPKSELRKIKQQVAKLRKKGHEIWTDDEVTAAGYTLEEPEMECGLGALVSKTKQSKSWDCGLACAEMALSALGLETDACSFAALRARLISDSVWTIDLAYLLADYGVRFEYLSSTCDVDETAYSTSIFYADVRWRMEPIPLRGALDAPLHSSSE